MDPEQANAQPHRGEKGATRLLLVLGALVAWIFYDVLVLLLTTAAVVDSGRKLAKGEWELVGAAVATPVAILGVTALVAHRRGHLVPDTPSSRAVWGAQALGLLGLASAVAVPVLFWRNYFTPRATIVIDNRTHYTSAITVDADVSSCEETQFVQPETTEKVTLVFTDSSCWGSKPVSLTVLNELGEWTCSWPGAKSRQPMLITEDSPGCAYTSYKPGPLRWPPTTGGPPFSPPAR